MGAAQVVALTPEGSLSLGRSILSELGAEADDIESIIGSLRADDYASIRNVDNTLPEQAPQDATADQGATSTL